MLNVCSNRRQNLHLGTEFAQTAHNLPNVHGFHSGRARAVHVHDFHWFDGLNGLGARTVLVLQWISWFKMRFTWKEAS